MKFARVRTENGTRPVVVSGDEAYDLSRAAGRPDARRRCRCWPRRRPRRPAGRLNRIDLADAVFEAPVASPGAVIAIGMNYAAHAAESGAAPPLGPGDVPQDPEHHRRARRRLPDPGPGGQDRLGGRAGHDHRQAGVRADRRRGPPRLRRRLHRGQRPVGADLPDRGVRRPVEQGEVRARLHPDRSVAGDHRRRRPPEPPAAQLGQRRAAAGLLDRRPDLRLPDDHPAPEPVPGARGR